MAVSMLVTGYYRHPKMIQANGISGGELAEVLWSRGLDYVNEHGTDGFIPAGAPELLTPKRSAIRVRGLVDSGLWAEVEGGWRVHNFLVRNRTADELATKNRTKSEARSVSGRAGAAARWGGKLERETDGKPPVLPSTDDGKPMANVWQTDGPVPVPVSVPVPKSKTPPPSVVPPLADVPSQRAPEKRATRCPETFDITPELIAWIHEKAPGIDAQHETNQWLDWHANKGDTGQNWVASWRMWMRKAQDDVNSGRSRGRNTGPIGNARQENNDRILRLAVTNATQDNMFAPRELSA